MTSIASVDQTTPAEIAAPATSRAIRVLGPLAAALAMLSAFATFVVLADLTPITPTHEVVVTLLLINAATVFLLVGIIAHEVWLVVQARRRGRAAARLHVQIVGLFAVIAAVPAILVAVVASVTLDRGLDRLFSTRTRAIIENSLIVADAYLQEHAQLIRGDIMAMSFDVTRAKPLFDHERERFKQFFTAQARVRGLSAAMLIGADAAIIERADIQSEQPVPVAGHRRPCGGQRDRTADRHAVQHEFGRRRHQAARLRQRLSQHHPPARSARGRAFARNAGDRQRLRQSAGADGSACSSPLR